MSKVATGSIDTNNLLGINDDLELSGSLGDSSSD